MNIFISGGSSGIGFYLVKKFLLDGHKIFTTYKSNKSKKKLVKINKDYKKNIKSLKINFSNINEVKKLPKKINSFFNYKVDLVINNAGSYGEISLTTNSNINNWISSINSNLISHYIICSKLSKSLIKNKRKTTFINISGGGAVRPMRFLSSYCASKSALVRITEVMAIELKKSNFRFYALAPGLVNTKIHSKFLSNKFTKSTQEHSDFSKALNINNNNLEKIYSTIVFLFKKRPFNINGKLISAQFDNIEKISKNKISKNLFSLRRIDNFFFLEKNKKFK